jgi:hypothetical protein
VALAERLEIGSGYVAGRSDASERNFPRAHVNGFWGRTGGQSLNGSGNYPGLFDLLIPPNGTITQAGNNFTIKLTATGLTAADLVGFLDTAGKFDAAVHLQDWGPNSGTCQPGQTGNNSLVVGELVPAPAIGHGLLVLLAVGGVLFGAKLLENLKRAL